MNIVDILCSSAGCRKAACQNYLSFVEQFLSYRFAAGEPHFADLCASDVTKFLKRQTGKLSPGRAKLLVTALRSFLRYLLHQGQITVEFGRLRALSRQLVFF
jgi:site-specific recombinase XerC